jgi:putative oxidoreductase
MQLDVAVPFVARLCLVSMFPFSALEKVFWWRNAMTQAKSGLVSGGPVMLVLAIIVEAVTPVLIVAGVFDRLAAFVLAAFCVATAVLYHPFWIFPDFWSARADSTAREHFWQFMKNFGLVGGLLLVAFASSSATRPAAFLSDPLSSTGVYRPAQTP